MKCTLGESRNAEEKYGKWISRLFHVLGIHSYIEHD